MLNNPFLLFGRRTEKINNDVLVTMLYDLKSKDNTNRSSIEEYLKSAEELYKIDCNMIFFVETDELKNQVYEGRYKYERHQKTHIIVQPYEDLKYYKDIEHIKALDKDNPITNMNIEKDTANYRIIGWNKFECLRKAIQLDPFMSEHFGWIDFGICGRVSVPDNLSQVITSMSNKIKIGIFNRLNIFGINLPNFYKTQKRILSAGFFTGNKENMLKLIHLFEKELLRVLGTEKIAPLEEQILAKIIYNDPDIFQVFWGHCHQFLFFRWLQ